MTARPVNGRAVPEHRERAGEVPQQMPQGAHHIRAPERGRPHHREEPPVGGDAADGREVVAGERDPQDGRVPARGMGPHAAGQEGEARFISPHDGPALPRRPLLSAGQRSAYHARIAAAWRCAARSTGCCGLQASARRRRLTCAGW